MNELDIFDEFMKKTYIDAPESKIKIPFTEIYGLYCRFDKSLSRLSSQSFYERLGAYKNKKIVSHARTCSIYGIVPRIVSDNLNDGVTCVKIINEELVIYKNIGGNIIISEDNEFNDNIINELSICIKKLKNRNNLMTNSVSTNSRSIDSDDFLSQDNPGDTNSSPYSDNEIIISNNISTESSKESLIDSNESKDPLIYSYELKDSLIDNCELKESLIYNCELKELSNNCELKESSEGSLNQRIEQNLLKELLIQQIPKNPLKCSNEATRTRLKLKVGKSEEIKKEIKEVIKPVPYKMNKEACTSKGRQVPPIADPNFKASPIIPIQSKQSMQSKQSIPRSCASPKEIKYTGNKNTVPTSDPIIDALKSKEHEMVPTDPNYKSNLRKNQTYSK